MQVKPGRIVKHFVQEIPSLGTAVHVANQKDGKIYMTKTVEEFKKKGKRKS